MPLGRSRELGGVFASPVVISLTRGRTLRRGLVRSTRGCCAGAGVQLL